jgi:hypothetical protein
MWSRQNQIDMSWDTSVRHSLAGALGANRRTIIYNDGLDYRLRDLIYNVTRQVSKFWPQNYLKATRFRPKSGHDICIATIASPMHQQCLLNPLREA